MVNRQQLCALHAFRPYLRLLKAFDCEHYTRHNWRSLRALDVLAVAAGVTLLITTTALAFWKIADVHYDMHIFLTSLPVIVSMIQVILTFLPLMLKCRKVDVAIQHLQAVISYRKSHSRIF